MNELFKTFTPENKKVKIKSLNNEEVTVKELSIKEFTDINKAVSKLKDQDTDLETIIKFIEVGLIEPKLTRKDILSFDPSAFEALAEIVGHITKKK